MRRHRVRRAAVQEVTDNTGGEIVAEEKGWQDAIANTTELAKLVYPDLLQPLAKEVGSTLGDVAKIGRLVLFPIQLAAVGQDRVRGWLDKLREVPEEERLKPVPEIAGPVLMHLPFTTEGQILETMYLNLLKRAMDKGRVDEAHPAFAQIISQLSADEAVLLMILRDHRHCGLQESESISSLPHFVGMERLRADIDEEHLGRLQFPRNAKMYLQHFVALNLLEMTPGGGLGDRFIGPNPSLRTVGRSRFSGFGELFLKACVPAEYPTTKSEGIENAVGPTE
jgi:Abortive infection alpha